MIKSRKIPPIFLILLFFSVPFIVSCFCGGAVNDVLNIVNSPTPTYTLTPTSTSTPINPTNTSPEIPTPQPHSGISYYILNIRNKCDTEFYIALRYQNLEGEWLTEGWWNVQPGEKIPTITTRANTYYYYAESPGGEHIWTMNDNYPGEMFTVDGQEHGFRRKYIDKQAYGNWTLSLKCDED